MRAYYSSLWHEDHSPRATAPQQPLRSLYIGGRAPHELVSLLVFSLFVRFYLEKRFSLSLCVSLGSSFSLSVRCSQKVHHLLQYIGAVDRIED